MEERKKSRVREYIIAACVLLIALGVLFVFRGGIFSKNNTNKDGGQFHVQVNVMNEKEDYEKTYSFDTNETILGDLLVNNDIIQYEDSDYGRFVTGVDGMKAEDSKEQWWSVLVNGESAATGIDGIRIQDGDVYTLEMKTGY